MIERQLDNGTKVQVCFNVKTQEGVQHHVRLCLPVKEEMVYCSCYVDSDTTGCLYTQETIERFLNNQSHWWWYKGLGQTLTRNERRSMVLTHKLEQAIKELKHHM